MEELKNRFHKEFPEKVFITNSPEEVQRYLEQTGWLDSDEFVETLEKAGEGNMNLVLRVRTNKRSFILKQARPWAEKFPDIPAPVNRNHVEANYFKHVNIDPELKRYSPELLEEDRDNFIIALEDLGDGIDYTGIYNTDSFLSREDLSDLLLYLNRLHQLECPHFPLNQSMRELNHEYIFEFPFREDNGLDLDSIQKGLMEASLPYKRNTALKSRIRDHGKFYLMEGLVLIHGDYFPGSWLRSSSGLKVIDPEFGFRGFAEFDLGVFCAHMFMAGQKPELFDFIARHYEKSADFDQTLFAGFTGIEILRRLLGVAQLPLSLTLEEKKDLMQSASDWILKGKVDQLEI